MTPPHSSGTAPRDAAVLVVQHEDGCPPGLLAGAAAAEGVELQVVRPYAGDAIPAPDGFAGLVVLGGTPGAYDDADAPWLPAVRDGIRGAVTTNIPFLGICLGHQLAAVALGGAVARNDLGPGAGATPYAATADAEGDPLLGDVPTGSLAVMWNNDVVVAPPDGATVLATSPDGTVHALRLGERAWTIQSHPEATPDIFDGWTIHRSEAAPDDTRDVVAAAEAVRQAEPQLTATWLPMLRRFVALCAR